MAVGSMDCRPRECPDHRQQIIAMQLERQTAKARWLRADIQPNAPAPDREKTEKRPQSHFVEPYRFETADRAELMQTLQTNRLGDEPGRRLFVAALEFEIGNFLQAAVDTPQPDPPKPQAAPAALERIGEAAAALASLLEAIDDETREPLTQALARSDRYGRSYNQRYLEQLRSELLSVQDACALAPPEEPPAAASEGQLSEPFIVSLAETYRECFEIQPTPAKTGPFYRVARKILEITGLPVRLDQKLLKAVLER